MDSAEKKLHTQMTQERVYDIADELYIHKDGTVTADYRLQKCGHQGHRGCTAIFKLLPCGCVVRGTWHSIVDASGEVVGAKWQDDATRTNQYRCREHRRRAMRKAYVYRSEKENP